MNGETRFVLDACVLIPMPLADTLLRLGHGTRRLYRPGWTNAILEEVRRNLIEKFGLSAQQAAHREAEMRKHFPDALVSGHDRLIPSMTNHPKDRHVLAAATHCHAQAIVTYNAVDFPRDAVTSPSRFLGALYDHHPFYVAETLALQARAIGRPLAYVLDRLSVNAQSFVDNFRSRSVAEKPV